MKMYLVGFIWFVWLAVQGQPQDRLTTLTLEQCYAATLTNYPLLKQQGI